MSKDLLRTKPTGSIEPVSNAMLIVQDKDNYQNPLICQERVHFVLLSHFGFSHAEDMLLIQFHKTARQIMIHLSSNGLAENNTIISTVPPHVKCHQRQCK